ncbi:MAG: pyridoxal-phosphate dependent enzyme [Candidatus Atribacteria bacterium]|nr:pyridoxal-phosphate dependent enzyme [Candidatus Atribacteria bacterium]
MVVYGDVVQAYEKVTRFKNPTLLQYSGTLSRMTDSEVFLKPENLQITGSFKLGGALNVMSNLVQKEKIKGVVTCSAGNWGQAVAYAARQYDTYSIIVMPKQASLIKIAATRGYGAEVALFGENSNDVAAKAQEIAQNEGLIFLSPFGNDDLIAGHGTVGLEIIKERPETDVVLCPVGSGAFIAGIALALKEKNPKIKIIGIEPENANAMWLSLKADKIVELEQVDTIADGLALKKPGEQSFEIVKKYVDEIVLVNEEDIKKAVIFLLERTKLLVEPSGAVTVAALMTGKANLQNRKIAAILSGGNFDLTKLKIFLECDC